MCLHWALARYIGLFEHLPPLVNVVAPELVALPGVGVDTAGQLQVTAGDNAGPFRSERSFARRTAEGKTRKEIMCCLNGCIAREACPLLGRPEPDSLLPRLA